MRDAIDERQVGEVEIMADEPFEDGFRFQMEKGLWIRLLPKLFFQTPYLGDPLGF